MVPATPAAAPTSTCPPAPELRAWQAKRIAQRFADEEQRPGYSVVALERRSRYRWAVTGHEPGYLDGQTDFDEPDVTVTLVERRGHRLYVYDPLTRSWARWL